MSVLLGLIEKDAATSEKLQDIGKQLLAIRTKVNAEITRMIMLRESTGIVRKATDDCDCGILDEIVTGMDDILNAESQEENVIDAGKAFFPAISKCKYIVVGSTVL